jgi:hypothetical protein
MVLHASVPRVAGGAAVTAPAARVQRAAGRGPVAVLGVQRAAGNQPASNA